MHTHARCSLRLLYLARFVAISRAYPHAKQPRVLIRKGLTRVSEALEDHARSLRRSHVIFLYEVAAWPLFLLRA